MNKTRTWAALMVAFSLATWSGALWAQAGDDPQPGDNPPEVLTSDLSLKTVLESNTVQVDFVIVDDDQVVEVTINGEPQTFEPSDTVLLTKVLEFGQEASQVVVTATDEAGNTKTVTYTVFPPGIDPDRQPKKQDEELAWFASYDARYENDDNPTQDLSSPFSIEGIDLNGVVPDDEQADTRTNIMATGGITIGPWSGFLGISRIAYANADLSEQYDVGLNFAGASYRTPEGGLDFVYLFSDINLGTSDYALTHTLSPGYRVLSEDADGTGETLYALDLIRKQFALTEVQMDTTVFILRWDYKELDQAGQDLYIRKMHLGTDSEGIEVTEYTFLAFDWDWQNRWDSGLLFDIGLGFAYRDLKNDDPLSTDTFLGDTRVDSPIRFSSGVGWFFSDAVRVMADYQYTFNLSNKSPFVRQIVGVGVNGTF